MVPKYNLRTLNTEKSSVRLEIKQKNYNLDIKNPHSVEEGYGDPEELLSSYNSLLKDIEETRNSLKKELESSIKRVLNEY